MTVETTFMANIHTKKERNLHLFEVIHISLDLLYETLINYHHLFEFSSIRTTLFSQRGSNNILMKYEIIDISV